MCFFFNDTATTEIYTLSLHDALPIWYRLYLLYDVAHHCRRHAVVLLVRVARRAECLGEALEASRRPASGRSEEHTSELQSRQYLVCRLLLEKKKQLVILACHISCITS